jgi:hypothetical protein
MATALDRDIRKSTLGPAVRKVRIVAEDGARKALTELGVEDAKRPEGLGPAQVELRNRLRAHARSLGDIMQSDRSIKANRLVREIAYEHWHRTLFARFLADNNLLIDPDHKVAVSLSELEQIANEEGRDLVELAADWAEPMLPQIFRKDDPVLALALPPETKAGITEIVKGLPRAVFEADDSLGWVYQFWQADEKDRVNEEAKTSGKKIGADELPAVTQLFTEDYMVLFLLENTLGAWWAGKVLAAESALANQAESEAELREKTSPPDYRWTYLRFVREPHEGETHETASGPWRPAAGTFEGWPKAAKEITVLDPCMGSGHFLVFALPILIAFRRAEERLDDRAAAKAVLAGNLYGLEIDPRCTQIAAFALALASWKRLGGPEPLPRLNLACSGLAIGLGKAEFLKLAERLADEEGWKGKTDLLGTDRTPLGSTAAVTHRGELEALYDLFRQAPYLGSLIDPHRTLERSFGPLYLTGIDKLGVTLGRILDLADAGTEAREVAIAAQGLAKAAALLSRKYVLAVTNVPFKEGKQLDRVIQDFVDQHLPSGSANLATAFMLRIGALLAAEGSAGVVTPHEWLFLVTYKAIRERMLKNSNWRFLADIGEHGFESPQAAGAFTALVGFTNQSPTATSRYFGLDVTAIKTPAQKAISLAAGQQAVVLQQDQLRNPGARIGITESSMLPLLDKFAGSYVGLQNGDAPRYIFFHWEVGCDPLTWSFFQLPCDEQKAFGGREGMLRWEQGKGDLSRYEGARIQGTEVWGRQGVAIRQTRSLPATVYSGDLYDQSSAVIVPHDNAHLASIWALCSSPNFHAAVRKIDKKKNVTNATLVQIPFDLAYWEAVAAEKYPNGLPKPYSNDPTQWPFDGHPRGSSDPNVTGDNATNPHLVTPHGVRPGMAEQPLQVAVARLVGYRWPRQTGSSFMDCPAVTEPDEVDRSGLVDADGIVPLLALGGEADAATRLRELIRAVWGPDYGEGTIHDLLVAENASANDLSTWLADEFFDGHSGLFHQTPFIWHVWDAVRGGFSALVNYHRLCEGNGAGRRLLEKLRDTYLGEWIAAQRRAVTAGDAGAEERLIAAEHLRGELTKIIDGDPPYDIFVRWKPLHRQPIGWEPDIDDGVRLNIRPFLTATPRNPRGKDACILRVTPGVKKYVKPDRGAEPNRERKDFPWFFAEDGDVPTWDFAGGSDFKGRRYNGFHYTRAFKQGARDARSKKS